MNRDQLRLAPGPPRLDVRHLGLFHLTQYHELVRPLTISAVIVELVAVCDSLCAWRQFVGALFVQKYSALFRSCTACIEETRQIRFKNAD